MIYEYTNSLNEISLKDINHDNDNINIGYLSSSEFEENYMDFGFSQAAFNKYKDDNRYFRSKIEIYDDYSFGSLKIIESDINDKTETHVVFYIKKNLMLIISVKDNDNSTKERFISAAHRFSGVKFTLEKFIFSFVDSLITDDNQGLEDLEFAINRLEENVLNDSECKNFNEELLRYKKKLLVLRNFYEQLIDIGEELYENENGIFEETNLRYFKIFTEKSERLCANVNLLKESLVQLREAYQSNLDLKLNNIMKIFTVITAIFLPLTLIVGWYGMNFTNMPEITWKYGYACVIGLSIIVVVVCIFIFKKKKLM